ncbi:MAG: M67 family peptidase, partial [Deltaproteobacteria bacterium]|nr:M67 family peptidase [Deltaproteobacteria bacterium]
MKIAENIREGIIAHARRVAPIEACGYLAGSQDRITALYEMENIDGREDHFSFDPGQQFAVHKKARQAGLRIIGVYHSHPVTPARPSVEDIKLAYDPASLYVIVSLADA